MRYLQNYLKIDVYWSFSQQTKNLINSCNQNKHKDLLMHRLFLKQHHKIKEIIILAALHKPKWLHF